MAEHGLWEGLVCLTARLVAPELAKIFKDLPARPPWPSSSWPSSSSLPSSSLSDRWHHGWQIIYLFCQQDHLRPWGWQRFSTQLDLPKSIPSLSFDFRPPLSQLCTWAQLARPWFTWACPLVQPRSPPTAKPQNGRFSATKSGPHHCSPSNICQSVCQMVTFLGNR